MTHQKDKTSLVEYLFTFDGLCKRERCQIVKHLVQFEMISLVLSPKETLQALKRTSTKEIMTTLRDVFMKVDT